MRVTSLLKMFMQMDSNNYPETLHHMTIINAPGWFATSWGAVKSVLSGDTVKKIEVGGWVGGWCLQGGGGCRVGCNWMASLSRWPDPLAVHVTSPPGLVLNPQAMPGRPRLCPAQLPQPWPRRTCAC